jgi:hypothetical protein
MTKVHYFVDQIKKLVSFLGYMDETLFARKYRRIAHVIRIPIQISAVKALRHFRNPGYRCFTFGDIDTTPTVEEYAQILNFPNDLYKVYFKQRIEDTTVEVTKLHLDQINQYKTSNEGFKWKLIENKLKTYKEKGKLSEDRYQTLAFSIFR